nr:DeoR/GlpR family DNA-binding transcription regulator [Salinicoccus roseus]
MEVFPEERKKYIMERLGKSSKVRVTEISEKFSVSTETVRRDLDVLERDGLVKRVYGGAVKTEFQNAEPPLLNRKKVKEQEKRKIAEKASELIEDGSTILLDVGTTVLELAGAIRNKKDVTILTNSLLSANTLLEGLENNHFSGDVILLGGRLNPRQYSISGKVAEMILDQFNVDQAFISVGGISLKNGLSDYDFDESMISRQMMHVSKEVIVLADSSKLDTDTFCKFGSLESVDAIISDVAIPGSWEENEQFKDINWITA